MMFTPCLLLPFNRLNPRILPLSWACSHRGDLIRTIGDTVDVNEKAANETAWIVVCTDLLKLIEGNLYICQRR